MAGKDTSNSQRTKRHISLGELREYTASPGRVAEDIFSASGAILLPRGTELASLLASVEDLEKTLRGLGVFSIPIIIETAMDIQDLENMLNAADLHLKGIDPALAKETLEQVENVYGRIVAGVCSPEDISHLANQGKALAHEVSKAPQVMFCLGKVRGWDQYTYIHSMNVALLGGFLASRLFPGQPEMAECVSMGGILHDLGKAQIPKEVLNKPGPLSDEEFAIMKMHPVYGEELAIANGVTDPRVLSVIRGHHERFGGKGYPDGLEKDSIYMEARIAAVADVFDALTARRVYKEPMESRTAVTIMVENMGAHFDPDVVRVLLVSIGLYPPGTAVELSDGSMGVVVGARGKDLMRPQVLLQLDRLGHKTTTMKVVDLSLVDNLFVQRPLQDVGKIAF